MAAVYPYEPLGSRIGAHDLGEVGRQQALATVADPAIGSYEHRILPSSSAARGLQYLAEDEAVESSSSARRTGGRSDGCCPAASARGSSRRPMRHSGGHAR